MKIEYWTAVVGFEGLYEVSSKGRVRSVPRKGKGIGSGGYRKGGILKTSISNSGYIVAHLNKDGKSYTKYVHRLVAQAFIPNPNNYPVINHRDENKQNNCVENLEWCTKEYNEGYGSRNKKISDKHKVKVLAYKDGELIGLFDSQILAAKVLNIQQPNISACCLGKIKKGNYKGFVFKFQDCIDDIPLILENM